jgi:glycosyltransferase involved in cell wall biosynthesis
MKIVFIITGLGRGGAELALLRLIQNIDTSFTCSVVSLRRGGELRSDFENAGISVTELGLSSVFPNPVKFFKLVKHLRNIKPDVVQTWMYHADLIGGIAAKFAGIKKIFWCIHNLSIDKKYASKHTRFVVLCLTKLSSRLPQKIISCSQKSIDAHRQYGYTSDKLIFIPNGFNLNDFNKDELVRRNFRKQLGFCEDDIIVGMIARNDPVKNHLGAVKAIIYVLERMPEIKFIFAGKGIDRENESLISELESKKIALEKSVFLLGNQTNVPNLINILDLLISTSHAEAFPLIIGEGMSCEVPCIATDAGDSAYIIEDTGTVVPVGDMNALADAILDFFSKSADERSAMGKSARKRISENFDIKKTVSMYESLYLGKESSCAE